MQEFPRNVHWWLFHLQPPTASKFLIYAHFLLHGQHHKVNSKDFIDFLLTNVRQDAGIPRNVHWWLFHLQPPMASKFLIYAHFLLHGQHHKVNSKDFIDFFAYKRTPRCRNSQKCTLVVISPPASDGLQVPNLCPPPTT